MVNSNRTVLSDTVDANEAFVGGPAKGKQGRGVASAEHKSLVLGMVKVIGYKDKTGKSKIRAGRVGLEVAKNADTLP